MRQSIVRVRLDRFLKKVDGSLHLRHGVLATLIKAEVTFYVKLVRDWVRWVLAIRASLLLRIEANL